MPAAARRARASTGDAERSGALLATSDLHVGHPQNRELVADLAPRSADDWLILAGDVAERLEDFDWALATLAGRFAKVIWTPGNHELSTHPSEPPQLRGLARYERLVATCRDLGVVTPEDPYPIWAGAGGPASVAPLFLLYDYSFLAPGASSKAQSLARAEAAGIMCTDEYLLHPDPYPTREDWCHARVSHTAERLDGCHAGIPLVLVTHWPLVRQPTQVLRHPEFAQWCGTALTADWHRRYRTLAAIYGHLHIPRRVEYDGVRFEEVSLGYPREWCARARPPAVPRQILPQPR